MVDYTLIRSKRKTLAIHITKDATVEVRAPSRMPKKQIDCFVTEKSDWITRHLEQSQQHLHCRAAFALHYGDRILLRGKEYPIVAQADGQTRFDGICFCLPPNLSSQEIKDSIVRIYQCIAKEFLLQRVDFFATQTGWVPTTVKVNGAKTRWGSCSGKNGLNFSWRLVMAEEDVIDYVVVHELAHTREHNHSKRFWALVESQLPDYRQRRKALKELQIRQAGENWDI